jgi:peptidoglycan-associated lipoprotein
MQTKLGLAVVVVAGSLWLAGCATGTSTTPPVEDKTTPSQTPTQPLPSPSGPKAGELSGTPADAALIAKRRVYFAFDSSQLDDENRKIVEAHARNLSSNPNLKVHLEGNCDERGTREYNIALGERRAQTVERAMRVLGVPANRITTVSYGEEKPVAPGHDESAWAQNRRVEILYR